MSAPDPSASCALCGLPVLGRPVRAQERDFCCEGCGRVFALARAAGLDELTTSPAERAERVRLASARKAAAAEAAGARRETLRIEGMWCSSCGLVLEEALLGLEGVLDAEASYAASLARVTWDPAHLSLEAVVERIGALGYRARPAHEAAAARSDTEELFLRFFVALVMGMWVMWPTFFLLWPAFRVSAYASVARVEWLGAGLSAVVLLYSGWPFLAGAWNALKVQRATMDTLVVLGTWTAWLYSVWATVRGSGPTYFESASGITTIVLFGRWVEALGTRDTGAALGALAAGGGAGDDAGAWLVARGGDAGAAGAWLVARGGEAGAASGAGGDAGGLAEGEAVRVEAASLAEGDVVAVRAGETVPVDGVVVRGASAVDRSRLTGEPMPVEHGVGDELWAGTTNLSDTLLVRATRTGSATLTARLAALAQDAAFAKSRVQRFADAVAGVFVPVVIAIALVSALAALVSGVPLGGAVSRAVAVLVVSCPCAMGLATPLVVESAMAAAARAGMTLRGGPVLERAGDVGVVAFDKTGTLTAGMPRVAGTLPDDLGAAQVAELLRAAATLEAGESHPLARAVLAAARAAHAAPDTDAVDAAGRQRVAGGLLGSVDGEAVLVGNEALLASQGVALWAALADGAREARERGEIVVWVARAGAVLGGLRFHDPVRADAADAVAALHARGIRTAMVSGDAEATCAAVARAVGITDVRADVLPHQKETAVRSFAGERSVAFVGDGINDAAALSAADLAIAVGGGAEVAVWASDVVLASPGEVPGGGRSPLSAVPVLLRIAARGRRVITENLAWAFSYNLVAVPLAASGRLTPVVAAIAMALSSLAVVANSLRVRAVR